MSLPAIDLPADPSARGRAHGEAVRELIAHNVDVYFERFEKEALLPRDEALRRAAVWWAHIEAAYPEEAAAMRGIAEGAGRTLSEIVALNVRYELLYSQFTVNAMSGPLSADGCTAFAALPEVTAGAHTLIGQNWDWIPEVKGVVLRERLEGGGEVLAFSEAGIDGGKIGMNSFGLGLAINGITSTQDAWGGNAMPFHIRCRRILHQSDFDAAVALVTETGHATAANYLIAQAARLTEGAGSDRRAARPARALNIEAAPHVCWPLDPREGTIVHTNHFVDPVAAGVEEPPSDYRVHSIHRRARLEALLQGPAGATDDAPTIDVEPAIDVERMMAHLRDHDGHPNSVCRHPDPIRAATYRTVASVIMDLDAGEFWVTDGPPCEGEYEGHGFEVRVDRE